MRDVLPSGWTNTTLEAVAIWSSGGTPSRSKPSFYSGTIPWIKTGELGPRVIFDSEEKISPEAVALSSAKVFPKGSVILAMYGATIGKASILGVDAATNQACAVGNPDAVDSLFLYYFLLSQTKAFVDAGKGGAQPNISQGIVKNWPILVPPRNEQTRIVAKLEELLSDLDAGVAELKAAQKKLGQYRQSLLKAAVEGTLTASWREQQRDNQVKRGALPETGAQLLQRILRERRTRWEAKQLAKLQQQGKTPPKDWQAKYPEPVVPDTSDLPTLPEGWVWASVEQLGDVQLGRQRSPNKLTGLNPVKYIRAANITEQGINFDDVLEMDFNLMEQETFRLKAGDVLLTEASGSPQHVGRPVIWPGAADLFCFQNTVLRFSPQTISSEFAFRIFQAWQKLGKFVGLAGGVGINHLSAGKFSAAPVPLPPLKEQESMVFAIEEAISLIEHQEQTIDISLKQSAAQRKNILKTAFSGQLVPQDPKDEPASVLLERIRTERANKEKQPKVRKTKETTVMKTFDINTLGDWIKNHPKGQFSFDELRGAIPGDYEMLKNLIFSLLAEQKPIIKQIFDQVTGTLQFQRVPS